MCPSLVVGVSFSENTAFVRKLVCGSCVFKKKAIKNTTEMSRFHFSTNGNRELILLVSSAESHHWTPPPSKSPQLGTPPYALFVQYTGWKTVSPGDNRREIDHPSFNSRLVSSGAHLPFFLSCIFMGTVCILAQRVQTIYVTSTMRQVVSTLDTWVLQP